MAQFKAKIIKLGNGRAIYLPKNVYIDKQIGDVIDVYTSEPVYTKENNNNVYTRKDKKIAILNSQSKAKKDKAKHQPFDICPKHKCFYKTCKC
ncbi:MAG TPA: hypothetical protein PLC43_04865 [Caldisericia bacterium]|nr:hypothetical protein [Caldisericia bacterium]